MYNLKYIRSNNENFKKKIKERNINLDVDTLLKLDKQNRELILEKEKLLHEKKLISKKNDTSLFKRSKEVSLILEKIINENYEVQNKINIILSELPNLALDDVPVGKDETFNKIINKNGKVKKFDFKPLSHYEIGNMLKLMDFDQASKTTTSRFVFLKNELALLERAISNFMLDVHTKSYGYVEISPPLIANYETMYGTGQIPKFENDQFELKLNHKNSQNISRLFLIPTAEVILTNIVKNSLIQQKALPLRFVASTPCFRKEAGSYGKDTKGMIRQHQFNKVELVSIVDPNDCIKELERMTNCAESILQKLKLPYQKVLLSTGDMGFSAQKTYDLEVWIPSENRYREISSCSSCGQFQSRRMKAKYKTKDNETDFLGTLNGSGLAIGRTLVAILENYQEKDGTIIIPEVLQSYTGGLKKITMKNI